MESGNNRLKEIVYVLPAGKAIGAGYYRYTQWCGSIFVYRGQYIKVYSGEPIGTKKKGFIFSDDSRFNGPIYKIV